MHGWRTCTQNSHYEVNRLGQIRRKKNQRLLKQALSNKGYPCVSLSAKGKVKRTLVHRLVASAFIPNPLNKGTVNHKNSDRTDCKAQNLEWCSQAENIQHAVSLGRMIGARGELGGASKIKNADIPLIRKDQRTQWEVARDYGVTQSTISRIKNQITYKSYA